MILDCLISKYLDGDLTPEEDLQLRQIVASDPLARGAFEEAALLHVEMATAKLPEVPKDLDAGVRREVSNRMASHRYNAKPPIVNKRVEGRWRGLRAMVAALLLVAAIPFGEVNLGPLRVAGAAVPASIDSVRHRGDISLAGDARRGERRVLTSTAGELADGVDANTDWNVDVGDASILRTLDVACDEREEHRVVEAATPISRRARWMHDGASIGESSSANSGLTAHSSMSSMLGQAPGYSANPFLPSPVPAKVTTTYGMGRTFGEGDVQVVEQLSVGIAYGIDDGTSVGVEIGTMRYDVRSLHRGVAGSTRDADAGLVPETFSLGTPAASATSHNAKHTTPSRPASVTVSEFGGRRTVQSMWGAVRLQRDVFSYGKATLVCGIAAGIANDGPMGYGRLGLRYALFDAASIHIGAQMQWIALEAGGMPTVGQPQTMTSISSITVGIGVSL